MSSAPIPWNHVRLTLFRFAPLWCGTAILFGALGVGVALMRSESYTARQPLVVRDEANRSVDRLGRFSGQMELKAAQETILEMTKNPDVVAAALRQIGPPAETAANGWPSTNLVDAVAGSKVNLLAAQGSEFGNTEVVYLQVRAENQQRAGEFCQAMYQSLTEQLRKVRRVRADSVIDELTHNRNLATEQLEAVTNRLHDIEVKFAADLGELRNLSDSISGDGTNRRALEETNRELRTAESQLEKKQALYQVLVAGAQDPQCLLVSGGDLLDSQPSLQRIKDGLIDAQLRSSELAGTMTKQHPNYIAANKAEKEIKHRMQQETVAVMRAMQPTIKLEQDRIERLRTRQSELTERLNLLALARTEYSKLDAEVEHRTDALAEAERLLTEAEANRSAAASINLIAELGPPQVSEYPNGPSGSSVAIGGVSAGLIFGLGCVFLIAPSPGGSGHGRRWSDQLGMGRRSTDVSGNQPNTAARADNLERRRNSRETQPTDSAGASES